MMQLHHNTTHPKVKQLAQVLEHRKPNKIISFYYSIHVILGGKNKT